MKVFPEFFVSFLLLIYSSCPSVFGGELKGRIVPCVKLVSTQSDELLGSSETVDRVSSVAIVSLPIELDSSFNLVKSLRLLDLDKPFPGIGYERYYDLIKGFITDDETAAIRAFTALSDLYVTSITAGPADPLAVTLVNVLNVRNHKDKRLLILNGHVSINFLEFPHSLFFFGKLHGSNVSALAKLAKSPSPIQSLYDSISKIEFTPIVEDFTLALIGRMPPDFTQSYADRCFLKLTTTPSSRLDFRTFLLLFRTKFQKVKKTHISYESGEIYDSILRVFVPFIRHYSSALTPTIYDKFFAELSKSLESGVWSVANQTCLDMCCSQLCNAYRTDDARPKIELLFRYLSLWSPGELSRALSYKGLSESLHDELILVVANLSARDKFNLLGAWHFLEFSNNNPIPYRLVSSCKLDSSNALR